MLNPLERGFGLVPTSGRVASGIESTAFAREAGVVENVVRAGYGGERSTNGLINRVGATASDIDALLSKATLTDERAATGAGRAPLSFEDKLVVQGDASRAKIVHSIGDMVQPSLEKILELDPHARVGFRGSLVDGLKNETKLGPNGERVAFDGTVTTKNGKPYTDPQGYDADFFIISDDLAAQFSKRAFFKDVTKLDKTLKSTFQEFGDAMQANPLLQGMKRERPSFRIYSTEELSKKSGSQYYFLTDEKR